MPAPLKTPAPSLVPSPVGENSPSDVRQHFGSRQRRPIHGPESGDDDVAGGRSMSYVETAPIRDIIHPHLFSCRSAPRRPGDTGGGTPAGIAPLDALADQVPSAVAQGPRVWSDDVVEVGTEARVDTVGTGEGLEEKGEAGEGGVVDGGGIVTTRRFGSRRRRGRGRVYRSQTGQSEDVERTGRRPGYEGRADDGRWHATVAAWGVEHALDEQQHQERRWSEVYDCYRYYTVVLNRQIEREREMPRTWSTLARRGYTQPGGRPGPMIRRFRPSFSLKLVSISVCTRSHLQVRVPMSTPTPDF